MTKFFIFLFLSLCFINTCHALQSISIGDNQTKIIKISANELSRIFVTNDKIQNVRGLEGAYILTKDQVQGQIYVKPTFPYHSKPFNLFITTQAGHNYNLFVMGDELPGQDIELKPTTPGKTVDVWEKNSTYSQLLIKLVTAMVNNNALDGYAILYPDKKTKPVKIGQLIVTLQKVYKGAHLSGEVITLQNKSRKTIELMKSTFYQSGVRAIAFLNPSILPRGQTIFYRVISND